MPHTQSSPSKRKSGLRRFWSEYYLVLRELKYLRKFLVLAIVFTLLGAFLEGASVSLILNFVQNLTEPQEKILRTGIEWLDIGVLAIDQPQDQRAYRIAIFMLIVTVIRCAFEYLGNLNLVKTQMGLIERLRQRMFDQLQQVGMVYFSKTRAGDLTYRITTELEKFKQGLTVAIQSISKGSILIAYMASALLISWQLSVVAILLFSLSSAAISNWIRRVREVSFAESQAGRNFGARVSEYIGAIRTVRVSNADLYEQSRFYTATRELLSVSVKLANRREATAPMVEVTGTIILVLMIFISFAILIPAGHLQVASLLTFLVILLRLMPTVRIMNKARASLSELRGPLNSVNELLRRDDKPYLEDGYRIFDGLQRSIEFVDVDFGYTPATLVLQGVNLNIERNQMTALVGASGSGKSTLIDLVSRLYDPTSGQILVDGQDLRSLTVRSLREKIAVVSQDTFIFHASVRDNIAYGVDDASDEQVWQAAKLANALEFIEDLPEGLDTRLGDRGTRLSGGQRQRIAIARALLRNPEILILDEATSALDTVSERLIQQSLDTLSAGKTVIAIAHRLSTIVNADKVVVLDKGRIVEQGTYSQLLKQRGHLWNYHNLQNQTGESGHHTTPIAVVAPDTL
jgi:ATP-binding cassette, subfamily B, bacterial MsbA